MKKSLLTLFLACQAFIAFTQAYIRGSVTDGAIGEPLPGAYVRLENTYYTTITDAHGEFVVRNLKPGKYILTVNFIGFDEFRQDVEINHEPLLLNIHLLVKPLIQDEVVIRSTRINEGLAGNSLLLDKKEIERQNLGQDLPFLLENGISTVTTSDAGNGIGYTGIRIRGTDMTRINVTVNSIPLNDPESHNVFWVDLPDIATSTEDIQVQRGVGTSTNGAASFGASINLKTSSHATEPYAVAGFSSGSFHTLRANLSIGTGLIGKHWSFEGRMSRITSEGYIDRSGSNLQSFYISGGYVDNKNLFRVNIFSGKEKTGQAWDGVPRSLLGSDRTYNGMGYYVDYQGNEQYYDNETDNYLQSHYQALYTRKISSHFMLHTALHATTGEGYYEQYKDDASLDSYSLEAIRLPAPYYLFRADTIREPDSLIDAADLIRQKHLDNYFYGVTGSLQYQSHQADVTFGGSLNQYTGEHFGEIVWAQVFLNGIPGKEWYRSNATKNDGNAFIKTTWRVSSKITFTGELQYRHIYYRLEGIDDDARDISQKHVFDFFNPKLTAYYRLNDRSGLYGYAGIANREPNRDNFVDAGPGMPVPQREKLYDLEAGYSLKSTGSAAALNVYYMYYQDQLILTGAINDVGAPVLVNVPHSYRLGLEGSFGFRISKFLSDNANFTISRNKIKGFTEYIDNWDDWSQVAFQHTNTDISFSPSIVAGNELAWDWPKGLAVRLISKFVSRQYIDNTQDKDRSLDPYLDHKLIISYSLKPRICKEIKFSILINNLLNAEYETNAWVYRYLYEGNLNELNGYFPQAGFNFLAGIQVKF